jgi:hypothetical protein
MPDGRIDVGPLLAEPEASRTDLGQALAAAIEHASEPGSSAVTWLKDGELIKAVIVPADWAQDIQASHAREGQP